MKKLSAFRAAVAVAWLIASAMFCAKASADEFLIPLCDLGDATYRGESGGLYGAGQNEPPADHRRLAKQAISKIEPRDAAGNPAAGGRIVLLAIGMSNTSQEFAPFAQLAHRDPRKRPELVLVNGAQGGTDAVAWSGGQTKHRKPVSDPWNVVITRLKAAGVVPGQVQVVWLKQALAGPARYGEFPGHAEALENALVKIIRKTHRQFPNLRVVFLSSRTYGGYAVTPLNPEPYAYESAFAVRRVILRQLGGDAELNCDPQRGAVRAPVLLWGPYLWADGDNPRKADGLAWRRADFHVDGTHPSREGRRKVAELLLKFFTNDQFGKEVFLR
jgi:hypothetical protein